MSKRLQVILQDEAWKRLDNHYSISNEDFPLGHISYQDLINEMILNATIDIKALQTKHTSIRKSLRALATLPDLDIDRALNTLMELKGKIKKKKQHITDEIQA